MKEGESMKKQFWEIIKDDRSKTYEILGLSSDDTALTAMTRAMQQVGMNVRCETPHYPGTTKDSIPAGYTKIGFREEQGLLTRLKKEYTELTQ
jgi:hypothetical protein